MDSKRDVMNLAPRLENIKAEELLARFRSKDDLYRYMTNQCKIIYSMIKIAIVGLFLPSYAATKIVFLRSIVADQKKVLK